MNDAGLFNVEYADVFGIPFDFTAKPVVAPPQAPRETVQVKAVRPERDALEIRFPRVEGYRAELPEDRLEAQFNGDSVLELTPDLIGATETRNSGIIGAQVDLNLAHTGDVRPSQVLYELTSHLLLSTRWRDANGEPQLFLFGQLKRIAKQWLDGYLVCKGGTYPAQLKYKMLADMACERINDAITQGALKSRRALKAILDPYNPTGSTAHVNFTTTKTKRYETRRVRDAIGFRCEGRSRVQPFDIATRRCLTPKLLHRYESELTKSSCQILNGPCRTAIASNARSSTSCFSKGC